MTTTTASLLQAILLDPADTDLRLIFADRLDDEGDEARAEFVRCQVRIAQIEAEVDSDEDCDNPGCPSCSELRPLRERERRLLSAEQDRVKAEWMARTPGDDCWWEAWTFRRGFVAEVRLKLADWLAHGKEIVSQQPVEAVVLGDRKPWRERPDLGWRWYRCVASGEGQCSSHGHLPPFLLETDDEGNEQRYSTPEKASAAASLLAINHARSLASPPLPPLPARG